MEGIDASQPCYTSEFNDLAGYRAPVVGLRSMAPEGPTKGGSTRRRTTKLTRSESNKFKSQATVHDISRVQSLQCTQNVLEIFLVAYIRK
jgi:hypothetical protein